MAQAHDEGTPIRKPKPGPASKATQSKPSPSKAIANKATPSKSTAKAKAKIPESPKAEKAKKRGRPPVTREEIVFVDPPPPVSHF